MYFIVYCTYCEEKTGAIFQRYYVADDPSRHDSTLLQHTTCNRPAYDVSRSTNTTRELQILQPGINFKHKLNYHLTTQTHHIFYEQYNFRTVWFVTHFLFITELTMYSKFLLLAVTNWFIVYRDTLIVWQYCFVYRDTLLFCLPWHTGFIADRNTLVLLLTMTCYVFAVVVIGYRVTTLVCLPWHTVGIAYRDTFCLLTVTPLLLVIVTQSLFAYRDTLFKLITVTRWFSCLTWHTDFIAYHCLKDNRWKKKALAVIPIKFGMSWTWNNFTTLVSVYYKDGTVAVTHGGVEMGQGINTKVW